MTNDIGTREAWPGTGSAVIEDGSKKTHCMSARRRVLVVKTSSLGDVVHALPAISDIARLSPGWSIDWVCEEAFADIPRMHGGVDRVIPCAIRRWRAGWTSAVTRAELAAFRRTLRAERYDAILDLQGLVKSALIVALAHGPAHGFDRQSAREPLATLAYAHRHRVEWGQHAIARNRLLAARASGSDPTLPLAYGLARHRAVPEDSEPTIIVLHGTSRDDKLWPEPQWRAFVEHVAARGFAVVLPWGNAAEEARSRRLAAGIGRAVVPERMPPSALAALFARARAVIGVDTGLVHLAAAVGAPCVCVFTVTDPALTGVIGEAAPAINLGGNGRVPATREVIAAVESWLGEPSVAGAGR
jgi:heptosyltransferase-1